MKKTGEYFLLQAAGLLCVCVLSGCTEEADVLPEAETPVKFDQVEAALHPYFLRFEQEALQRGMEVDLTAANIRGIIQEIEENQVAGQCRYNRLDPRLVTIDASFWRRASDLFKEFIVFHELGHCFLNRPHLETAFSNGVCTSIMRSGTGSCIDNYNRLTRQSYIDELFEPNDVLF